MVTKQGNLHIYDNFQIGIAEVVQEPGAQKFCHISFGEKDFPEDQDYLNHAHVFKIHESQLDKYIEMLQAWQGKKHIHIATPGDMP